MNIEQGNLNKNSINYCVKKLILNENPKRILNARMVCFKQGLNKLSYFQLMKKLWTIFEYNYHLKYFQNCFTSVK